MKKNLISAVLIGFACLGTAQASELNQDIQFMDNQELHDISGAKFVDFTNALANQWITEFANTHRLTKQQKQWLRQHKNLYRDHKKGYYRKDVRNALDAYAKYLKNGGTPPLTMATH